MIIRKVLRTVRVHLHNKGTAQKKFEPGTKKESVSGNTIYYNECIYFFLKQNQYNTIIPDTGIGGHP